LHSASVYRLKDRFLVHPNCRTSTGIRVAVAPFTVLPRDVNVRELGSAIEVALSESTTVVPHPTDWKNVAAPRLISAGVKSEATFQKRSALVQLSATDEEIRIVPTKNGGAVGESRGFHEIPTACIAQPHSSPPEAIGAQVLKAFDLCVG
jgi:hypothetical protein